jgi:3-deoxy-D-arabino-heptulosonate 7-phosphate (DAHP) synthase
MMEQYVDLLLVGSRNMQNYPLLSALGDGAHSLNPAQFEELMAQLRKIAEAVGRKA